METISSDDINQVLRSVMAVSDDGDIQLSLLACALVSACLSCEVAKETALEIIGQVFDEREAMGDLLQRQTVN